MTMELREWRKQEGLSRRELAAMLGVHRETIKRYETGTRTPPADVMVDLYLLSGGRLRPDHLCIPVIRRLYAREAA